MAYLGTGEHHGKVSDLAYHNSLMVQVWSMLARRDARLAAHALQQLPPPPSTTAWITYARCHDDIGWAISDDGRRRGRALGLRAPPVPLRLLRRRVPRLVGARAGVPGEPGHRRPPDLGLAGLARRDWRRGTPGRVAPDPAGARGGARLRRAAGDLDGRRARAAQRPRLGGRARARRRQPLGAPARGCRGRLDADESTDEHGITAGVRRLVEVRASLPHLHASVAARGARPARPRACCSSRAATRSVRCSAPTT